MQNKLKEVGKRLNQYLAHKKIGINQLGRITGTSGAQISNIINGKNYGMVKLLNILYACPDLNLSWLIHGDGPMTLSSSEEKSNIRNETSLEMRSLENDLHKKVMELEEEKAKLNMEVEKLKSENSSLEGAVTYQGMTIEAYKNSNSVLSETNQDLKELLQHYKSASNTETRNRETA